MKWRPNASGEVSDEVVELYAERLGDLLHRADRALALAGLDLRQVGLGDGPACRLSGKLSKLSLVAAGLYQIGYPG